MTVCWAAADTEPDVTLWRRHWDILLGWRKIDNLAVQCMNVSLNN